MTVTRRRLVATAGLASGITDYVYCKSNKPPS
jgi:hypothetical protein